MITSLLPWLKVFHLTFVVTWFAALFYLPRLFVYHVEATDQTSLARFEVMEKRLYFGILLPSSLLVLLLGIFMTIPNWEVYISKVWYWIKVSLVVLLFGYQGMCSQFRKQIAAGTNSRSHVFYRWFNEVPLILLVVILIMVVIKPF